MSTTLQPPPALVCAAFGIRDSEPELLSGGLAWRCGENMMRSVDNPAQASWVAQTLDTLQVDGIRIARPLRATDGRWVVSGWTASRLLSGQTAQRHDEVITTAIRLHQATANLPRPRFLDAREDVFAVADRVSWGERATPLDNELGGRLFTTLTAFRQPMRSHPQVVHGDLFGTVLFAGSAPPAIIDFVPYWRPTSWAAAIVVIDALAWGDADEAIIARWEHLPEWPQALLRALLFRLAAHALHPHSTRRSLAGLERVAQQITELL